MTRRTCLLATAALLRLTFPGPAEAETLRDALLKAYRDNPTLTGARAGQRAADEAVPIARAAALPSVNLSTGYNENVLQGSNTLLSPNRELTGTGQVAVPLYSGGGARAGIRAAETRVDAGVAQLRGTESGVFTSVVAAFMNVTRDEAIVSLNRQNVRVLDINLQATRDRFQVGDVTRTDVAQSEARLALARGQLQTAEANLISSREGYIRVVGSAPGTLEAPPSLPNLPTSPDAAVDAAIHDNPSLLAARRASDATRYDIDVAKATRLPRVSIVAGGNYFNYLGSFGAGTGIQPGQAGTSATAGVSLTIPLFQGGRPAAQVRQAQAQRSQSLEAITETERAIVAQTRSAYAIWKSSIEVIASSQTAVSANKLSLEGVRAENSVGNRTIIEVLNAEQELLNSQVTLVTAQRDAYVAGFALLAATGHAEARDLGLDGAGPLYDPSLNLKRVRHRINDFGRDPDPRPLSTGTATTPAQSATVNRPLDPELDIPVDSRSATPARTKR